jgi:hypothetical protein
MSQNLFVLSEQEEAEDIVFAKEFSKKTSGYLAIIRFRNLQDYNDFCDKIDNPELKKNVKPGFNKTTFPKIVEEICTLESLLGEE